MSPMVGAFALDPVPAGSYTLSFKARPANASKGSTSDKVIVATLYSIKVEGTKRPVNQTGLTSDQLVAGVEIAVEVGPGRENSRANPSGGEQENGLGNAGAGLKPAGTLGGRRIKRSLALPHRSLQLARMAERQ